MSKEAMKLALEVNESIKGVLESVNALVAENKALKEALAKQKQGEPVAHCEAGPNYCWKCLEEAKPTYGSEEIRKLREVIKNYTTPQQRTWVGLTDDDKVLIKHDANFNQFMTAGEYADRVQQLTEARLKDLNT
jgi:phosphopantetheinyl transferase (holo-ACP synthase)